MTRRTILLLAALAVVTGLRADVVNVGPERGRALPNVRWTDENGRTRELSEFSGYPVLLLPIYTRCRGACVQSVARLKEAMAKSSADPAQFRVFLFSFDATDTPATLAAYREREQIPLSWSVGSSTQADIDALLESVGVPVGKAGKEFTHPNILVFLDGRLRVAKWIYGTDYSGASVDRALQVAAGHSDWLGRNSDLFFTLLVFLATIFCVALFQQILRRPGVTGAAAKSA